MRVTAAVAGTEGVGKCGMGRCGSCETDMVVVVWLVANSGQRKKRKQ